MFHKDRILPNPGRRNRQIVAVSADRYLKDENLHLFVSSPLSSPIKLDRTGTPDPAGALEGYEWERIETNISPRINFGMFILSNKIYLLGGDRNFKSSVFDPDVGVVWISDGTVEDGTVSQGLVETKPMTIVADVGAGRKAYNNVETTIRTT